MASEAADKGAYLAKVANCSACHTAPDGKPFAGGLQMATPLGGISTTNITTDDETGIGRYSLADFARALRRGIARDGRHLYPAMPYPSYAKLTDGDVAALFAYFRTVVAVRQANAPAAIPWLLSFRWPLAVWNLLFSRAAPFEDRPDETAAWNRGAYLVQGPGHCGACHTPRGYALQEKALDDGGRAFLAGAPLDGWSAPDLRGGNRTGLGRWSTDDLAGFLATGHSRFGTSFGTMNEVINSSTQYLVASDLAAIATYLKSLQGQGNGSQAPPYTHDDAGVAEQGAVIYWRNCLSCHSADGRGQGLLMSALAGNPAVLDPDPSSIINVVLNGTVPLVISGVPDRYRMPQFRRVLDDNEIAEVTGFIRQAWGNAAQPVSAGKIGKLRQASDFVRYRNWVLTMQ